MEKMLFTTDTVPVGMEIKKMYPMTQFTGRIEISNKGLFRAVMDKNRNEYQEIMESFARHAPVEANAIIGVQISTSAQKLDDGTFLYVTYIGTPAVIGDIE